MTGHGKNMFICIYLKGILIKIFIKFVTYESIWHIIGLDNIFGIDLTYDYILYNGVQRKCISVYFE